MNYPVAVDTKDLMAYLEERTDIAWALLDEKGSLLGKGGNEASFGLNHVDIGQYLADYFFCLEGLLPLAGVPYEIYELELLPDKFINIYCFPTREGDRIIFHDISEMANVKNMIHKKTQEIMAFLDNYRRNTG
jgi:hypothetical protein